MKLKFVLLFTLLISLINLSICDTEESDVEFDSPDSFEPDVSPPAVETVERVSIHEILFSIFKEKDVIKTH